ncbi:CCA tRNA nucleotidyltransferase [candidate division WOR-3 bacterium]|nr:CCA tRNA nucleotidyltransferase [candidate division WOR-3 bacterium]
MERVRHTLLNDQRIKTMCGLRERRELYCVGGTIRDLLLGIEPQDYDFAVSGSGIRFARSVARKLKGTLVILSEAEDEARVVTGRVHYDMIGLNDRSLEQDLLRRDFTVNAMAMDCATGEFFDPCNGMKDLHKGIVRPTQERSLVDDPLRVLRGFRFALELGFRLTRSFYSCARDLELGGVAAERIGYEILRIFAAPGSYMVIRKMNDLGLFERLFPEAGKIISDAYLWSHSLGTYEALENLMEHGFFKQWEPEFSRYFQSPKQAALVKLAGLFHDVAKPDTFLLKEGEVHFYGHDVKGARIVQTIGYKRLKLSRHDVGIVTKLVKEHMRLHLLGTCKELTDRAIRRFFRDLGADWLGAMMIAWADGYATAGWTQHLEEMYERMIALKRADDAKPTVERLVTGYDLITLGLEPGPKFKVILQELYDLQLEGKLISKEQALEAARMIFTRL